MVALIPTLPVSLRERIREEIDFDPKADDRRIAERVLRSVSKNDLLPLVIEAVDAAKRERARRHETLFDGIIARFPKQKVVTYTPEQQRNILSTLGIEPKDFYALCREEIDFGDGTSQSWGEAKKEQLIQRRLMIARQMGGLQSTLTRLDTAIRLLDETGAGCLNELKPLVPA